MLNHIRRYAATVSAFLLVFVWKPATLSAQATPSSTTRPAVTNVSPAGPKSASPSKARKGKKTKQVEAKEVPPPPPPPPPTPEQMPAVPPEVIYSGGMLTINAQNSTMNDVLSAVRRVTGASIEKPPIGGSDRVVAHIGPGQPKDVLEALFNGSRYDYIILGPMGRPGAVERVILTARANTRPGVTGTGAAGQPPRPNAQPAAGEPEEPETDTEDMTVPEREEPEQQQPPPGQPQVQPQQPPGQPQQPPVQGYPQGMPQQPPQEQQPQPQAQPQDQQNQTQQPRVKTPEELLRELQQMQKQPPDQNQQQQEQPPQ